MFFTNDYAGTDCTRPNKYRHRYGASKMPGFSPQYFNSCWTAKNKLKPNQQERFAQRFKDLQGWEQTQLLASLQRIAAMMDAEDIDAAPVLSSGSVLATVKAVEEVLEPEKDDEDNIPVDKGNTSNIVSK